MTEYRIKLPGAKDYVDRHGRRRVYHRKSGRAVDLAKFPYGSAEMVAEYHRIAAEEAVQDSRPGSLGALIQAYKAHKRWQRLGARTKEDYDFCLDYLAPLYRRPLHRFDGPFCQRLYDDAIEALGWKWGDYALVVLSILFNWGVRRGYLAGNPCTQVEREERPAGLGEANRPWDDGEVDAVLAEAHPALAAAVGMAVHFFLREGDIVAAPKSAYDGEALEVRTRKSGTLVWLPMAARQKELLAAMTAAMGRKARARYEATTTLIANSRGKPWTESGLRSSFTQLKQRLEKEEKVKPGLTLHGLRHTAAGILDELEVDPQTIADVLGHKTLRQQGHYKRRSNKRPKAEKVVQLLEERRRRGKAAAGGEEGA